MDLVLFEIPLDEVDFLLLFLLILDAVESCSIIAVLHQYVSVSFEEIATFMCPPIEKVYRYFLWIFFTANDHHLFKDVPSQCDYLRRVFTSLDPCKLFAVSRIASQEEVCPDLFTDVLII